MLEYSQCCIVVHQLSFKCWWSVYTKFTLLSFFPLKNWSKLIKFLSQLSHEAKENTKRKICFINNMSSYTLHFIVYRVRCEIKMCPQFAPTSYGIDNYCTLLLRSSNNCKYYDSRHINHVGYHHTKNLINTDAYCITKMSLQRMIVCPI